MKRRTSKTQLAILSLLAGLVYVFIITADVMNSWKSGTMAFKEGMQMAEMENKTGEKILSESFTLSVEPKNYNQFYSDSLKNLKTGESIPVSYSKIEVRYNHIQSKTTKLFLLDAGMLLVAIPILIIFLLILILFYKLVWTFYKDNIFSSDNIRRLKLLGIFTIVIYVLQLTFYIMYYKTTSSLIELSDYKVIMPDLNHETLLIGIVLLIATNVMKRSLVLKEEQDLTI